MIDAILILMALAIVAALGATAFSALRNLRQGVSGFHRTTWATLALLVVVLLVGLIFSSSNPLKINGNVFADAFWLRLSDVLIISSVCLFVVACAGIVYNRLKR